MKEKREFWNPYTNLIKLTTDSNCDSFEYLNLIPIQERNSRFTEIAKKSSYGVDDEAKREWNKQLTISKNQLIKSLSLTLLLYSPTNMSEAPEKLISLALYS